MKQIHGDKDDADRTYVAVRETGYVGGRERKGTTCNLSVKMPTSQK